MILYSDASAEGTGASRSYTVSLYISRYLYVIHFRVSDLRYSSNDCKFRSIINFSEYVFNSSRNNSSMFIILGCASLYNHHPILHQLTIVNVFPAQMDPLFTITIGAGNTVKFAMALAVQPTVLEPVTV